MFWNKNLNCNKIKYFFQIRYQFIRSLKKIIIPQALSASGEQLHRFLSKGSAFRITQGGIARLDLILLKWGGLALLGLALDAIAVSRF